MHRDIKPENIMIVEGCMLLILIHLLKPKIKKQ
jgi:serine/threonine protein kinase